MKWLFLTSYYQPFLERFYASHSGFEQLSFDQMRSEILRQYFADTGALFHYMTELGNETFLIIENCEPLQKKWASENAFSYSEVNWKMEIAMAQIKKMKPDIFYIESIFEYYGTFLKEAKEHCKHIVSWISTPYNSSLPLSSISLILSSTPAFVEKFRQGGIKSEYLLPAFDQRIPGLLNNKLQKDIPFSFVGGWSSVHVNRKTALETLVRKTDIQLWGYGYEKKYSRKSWKYYLKNFLPEKDPVMKRYNGELWGLEMYSVLRRSLITFNIHEALLEGRVGNMRMFEASGVGTMLLNDEGTNLAQLFEPGKEIEVYRSLDEAIEKINYYEAHPEKAIEMGKNAQARTLKSYTYEGFTQQLSGFVQKL